MTIKRTVLLVNVINNAQSVEPLHLDLDKTATVHRDIALTADQLAVVATGGVLPYTNYTCDNVPDGLSFDTATGKFSGTASAAGRYEMNCTVDDAQGTSDAFLFAIEVQHNLEVGLQRLPDAEAGFPYECQLHNITGNVGALVYDLADGTLPDGITLSDDGLLSSDNVTQAVDDGSTVASHFTISATDSVTGDVAYASKRIVTWPQYRANPDGPPTYQVIVGMPTIVPNGMLGGKPPYKFVEVGSDPPILHPPASLSFAASSNTVSVLAYAQFPEMGISYFSATDALGNSPAFEGFYLRAINPVPSTDEGNLIGIGSDGALFAEADTSGGYIVNSQSPADGDTVTLDFAAHDAEEITLPLLHTPSIPTIAAFSLVLGDAKPVVIVLHALAASHSFAPDLSVVDWGGILFPNGVLPFGNTDNTDGSLIAPAQPSTSSKLVMQGYVTTEDGVGNSYLVITSLAYAEV